MEIELRPITPDEFEAFSRSASHAFGDRSTEEGVRLGRTIFDFEGSIAAFAGDRIVGTGVLFPFTMTVPGGREVRAGGVSWITVQPDFRRRGVLTSVMRREFEDAPARGEPLTILYASESIIYGRFGYGMATQTVNFRLDTRHGRLARSPEISGRVRLVDKEAAREIFPDIYERVRATRPGGLAMLPGWWDYYFADSEEWWRGAGPRFYAVYEDSSGCARGYTAYRFASKWEQGLPQGTLRMGNLETETPEARAGLWRFLLSVDLIQIVETNALPPDEPLRFMLADPRRLQASQFTDALWVRIVEVCASLEARRYLTDNTVVLDLTDRFLPENSGRYELSGGPDGAECRRTDRSADLRLEIADLGAIYLGGTRLRTLAEAGRVQEVTPGALARADLMFSSQITPYVGMFF